MPAGKKSTPIAVDTNFLARFGRRHSGVLGSVGDDPAAVPEPLILIPPTVIDELVVAHDDPADAEEQRLARIARTNLRSKWKFRPMDREPVGHGIVERIAANIRERGYLPPEEINDSFILAEAALLRCALLVTADNHLLDVPAGPLRLLLNAHDVATPLIVAPRKIARDFFPK
ncbi:MAG: DNA-binding protein [Opitutus sp.]